MLNAIRTTFLLAVLTGLFMAIGFVIGGTGGMMLALMIALMMNLFSFWNSDKIVLRMQNAQAISYNQSPDLYEMVGRLSENAGIPAPQIYLIQSDQPNAFATGRNPENAAVAVSTGLIKRLDYDEIEAVVAHELAHVRSRDTLTMTITATLAGAISMLAQFGLFFGARNNNSPIGPIGSILMVIVAPLAALLVQMAVSRVREYEADRDGAEICGNPEALARALDKIATHAKQIANPYARRSPGMAHMYIINPLIGQRGDNLFSTHPDVKNRIAALLDMAKSQRVDQNTVQNEAWPRSRHIEAQQTGRAHKKAPRSAGWRVPQTARDDQETDKTSKGPWG